MVDEELRRRRVRVTGAGHGNGAARVLQAVFGFVLDGLAGGALRVLCVVAAALNHETLDHAVKHQPVVVAVLDVLHEVVGGLRRGLGIKRKLNGAGGGVQANVDGFSGDSRGHDGSEE